MKISMPFLGTDPMQLPVPATDFEAVEVVIFDRSALDMERWQTVWNLVARAATLYSPQQVTFHFPVNDCDYVDDPFVRRRLKETMTRCLDNGLHGIVVHSNRIRPIASWQNVVLPDERERVIGCLTSLTSSFSAPVPLYLENMPIMDNYGVEIDPLFIYPADFTDAIAAGIQVVWDVCHYSTTVATSAAVYAGRQSHSHYPNLRVCNHLDFLEIGKHIRHWHFSAFLGVAVPFTQEHCREGVHPLESTLGPAPYLSALRAARSLMDDTTHMVLEIQERDYTNRSNFRRVRKWIAQSLEPNSPRP